VRQRSTNGNSHGVPVDLGRARNYSISSRNKLSDVLFAGLLLFAAAVMVPAEARAAAIGDPPPGAIFDLVAHTTTLTSYTLFTTSFVATVPNTTVSFAFREAPAYFAFDSASITGTGLTGPGFVDPGFESALIGQNIPSGWNRWITPEDVSAIGVIVGSSGGNCSPNTPHASTQQWCDGSVEGYDAIYQTIATTVGGTYTITFWLGDNSGRQTAPTIDMLVYATDGLPTGSIPFGTPEPASFVLIGVGLAGIAFARRRRRTA
jgi:hypothetical protein